MPSRYDDISVVIRENQRITGTATYRIPPESAEDYYVISTLGDRFDILAKEYYGSDRYWYILAAANPQVRRDTLQIEPGIQLRIPLPLNKVLISINAGNKR